ncbi:MAG TPA: hypothetical protein PKD09_16550 [Aggregatilinea sp.]|uniref:hypothetical protein n=1 Tax=Aggregatilinea sp. TaxID=2806333 RepID=UPI002C426A31|nr:hypothetical protein [Aggregatilinea sp.]HML23267.1 hypothetical protein [Aggregatilinea sp.]
MILEVEESVFAATMNANLSLLDRSPRQVLTKNDVRAVEGQPVLPLSANGLTAYLPLKNVNAGKQDVPPVWIAWFDPLENEAGQVGVDLIAPALTQIAPDLTIQPASSKSEGMIAAAVQRAGTSLDRSIPLVTLLGGMDLDAVQAALVAEGVRESDLPGWTVSYQPITGKIKHMAVLPSVADRMVEILERGGQVTLVDDIYSSGATVRAAREVMGRALARRGYDAPATLFPVVAVAQEVEGDYDDAQRREINLVCDAVIPVIVGPLDDQLQ